MKFIASNCISKLITLIKTELSNYLPLSGGTMTGELILANGRLKTIYSASGNITTAGSYQNMCSITSHPKGVFLIIGFADASTSFNSTYNIYIDAGSYNRAIRVSGVNGGGGVNVLIADLNENTQVVLKGYIPSGISTTLRGRLEMIRLS